MKITIDQFIDELRAECREARARFFACYHCPDPIGLDVASAEDRLEKRKELIPQYDSLLHQIDRLGHIAEPGPTEDELRHWRDQLATDRMWLKICPSIEYRVMVGHYGLTQEEGRRIWLSCLEEKLPIYAALELVERWGKVSREDSPEAQARYMAEDDGLPYTRQERENILRIYNGDTYRARQALHDMWRNVPALFK